ncbi:MAG: redoxin family protein [Arenicella sp.]|nr:redoxin family protein [Arenicella sp.]
MSIKTIRSSVLPALVLLLLSNTVAAEALIADNFVLIDHHGKAQELYYHSDDKAVVIVAQGNGCQIVRSNLEDLRAISNDYADQGVEILMLNANMQDTRATIVAEAKEWGNDFAIMKDRTQIIARSLKLSRTGEVLVIDPRNWQVVYRGPLSDRVDFERQKNKADKRYVRDTLDALIAGKKVTPSTVNAPGCIINYDDIDPATISYSETIAPILKENCVACHVQGGIAPWAMSEYAMIKGFAPMMREVVRTKRMPPWHADPDIGHWRNEVGMSDEDTKTLITWIEAGAPRGEGDDPLTQIPPLENVWTLGEPDLIVDIPAFEIPASGTVDYQFPNVPNPYDRDVWVVAAEVIPGDPKAVHHILAGSSDRQPKGRLSEIFENFIITYAPGNEASSMPAGTGVFVPKGGVYQFQMHYTPYGKKTVDRSRIGLHFSDKPPANFYREQVIVNFELAIPANAEQHEEKAYFMFDKDAEIHALFPHSHYRGVSSTFELQYPDGKVETILSVPNYDFNWQRTYQFTEPKRVPAGSKVIHRTIYNNSSKNRGNPAPDEIVYWGLQSEQEMLYGSVGYSWVNESTDKPIHNPRRAGLFQMMGLMDQDLDGKVSKSELTSNLTRAFADDFGKFDASKDGLLDLQELAGMLKTAHERPQQ